MTYMLYAEVTLGVLHTRLSNSPTLLTRLLRVS